MRTQVLTKLTSACTKHTPPSRANSSYTQDAVSYHLRSTYSSRLVSCCYISLRMFPHRSIVVVPQFLLLYVPIALITTMYLNLYDIIAQIPHPYTQLSLPRASNPWEDILSINHTQQGTQQTSSTHQHIRPNVFRGFIGGITVLNTTFHITYLLASLTDSPDPVDEGIASAPSNSDWTLRKSLIVPDNSNPSAKCRDPSSLLTVALALQPQTSGPCQYRSLRWAIRTSLTRSSSC